ncbi:MAG: methionyl-tRNA formyltransferase [Muribaculaceae bacterium]|nr:methionyl-tRNA formyltransferase [Muribaculaceae bacterium]
MNKEDLRIVFLGTPDFAVESLDRLVSEGYNIVSVVTATDKPAGRGHHLLKSAVKQYAEEKGIPVLQPKSLKDPEFLDQLRALNAQLFIVIAFRMLPEAVWAMPPMGTFNLHAALLPRYRGAAPINHAVMNGDKETGVTTFMLKHEIDTGDILRQERIEIGPDENVGSVHDRLMHLGAELTLDTVSHILVGDLKPIPQAELEVEQAATYAPKIFKEDCRIDWTRPAQQVHNFVRGLSPYPAAWSVLCGDTSAPTEIKIFATALAKGSNFGAPGQVSIVDGKMVVACGDGAVEVLEVRPAGKKQMPVDAYLRGARLVNPRFEA